MKFLLIVVLAVLSGIPKDQLSTATGCTRRYLRRINGKCYYFSVKKMNWFGALNNCLRKGLTLADLSNPRDFYGAIGFLSSKGNTEDFWFGGNDLQHEGRFQYISNGRLVRFYSNYSIVEPAGHSECDDCLEVRIRPNITVVADDNCMERQYFICSERYCDDEQGGKKPRHHSHEHLHHFHHDIGDASEDEYDQDQNEKPIASGSTEVGGGTSSEQQVGGTDVVDATPTAPVDGGSLESVLPVEGSTESTTESGEGTYPDMIEKHNNTTETSEGAGGGEETTTLGGGTETTPTGDGAEATPAVGPPTDGQGEGGSGGQQPGTGGEQPGAGGQQPGTDGGQPGAEGQQPGTDGEQTGAGGQQPGTDGEQTGAGGQQPGTDGEQTGAGGQQPGTDGEQTAPSK